MCTLSWIATPRGYELFFNRDELRSRAPEAAPLESTQEDARVLAPRDGSAGGTWIAVNEFGVSCALLNGYFESRAPGGGARRSRGLLVLDLAGQPSIAAVQEQLGALDLGPYEPFVLCVFEAAGTPGSGVPLGRAFDWDGLAWSARELHHGQDPECSSGYDAEGARQRRVALWRELAGARADSPQTLDSGRLAAFHRSHLDGAGAYSPCMHREDAETRSMVHVRVGAREVQLAYTPGAPCRTEALAPVSLPRRAAHSPQS